MRQRLRALWRWIRLADCDYSAFELGQAERLEMIAEIQLQTFSHLDPDEVKWVTSWALTLGETSDEQLLRAWEAVHGGK